LAGDLITSCGSLTASEPVSLNVDLIHRVPCCIALGQADLVAGVGQPVWPVDVAFGHELARHPAEPVKTYS
jgi:hypothetical protein